MIPNTHHTIDLSKLGATPEDYLHPGERLTARIAGKAYMWARTTRNGPLALHPGHAPGDPFGCQMVEPVGVFQPSWPRVCILHVQHAGRHLHRPTLDSPGERWGPDRPSITTGTR